MGELRGAMPRLDQMLHIPAPGATGAENVYIVREFTGEADWVLWGGKIRGAASREGAPGRSPGSTVVRMTDDRPVLLREGVIPFRTITEFLERG